MTLVDTSVWINHFRRADAALSQLLSDGAVRVHAFSIGELACGNFKDRKGTLTDLRDLPAAPIADEAEVSYLLDHYQLWGTGLGWVDLHIITVAALTGWSLFTADAAMQRAARKIGIPSPD